MQETILKISIVTSSTVIRQNKIPYSTMCSFVSRCYGGWYDIAIDVFIIKNYVKINEISDIQALWQISSMDHYHSKKLCRYVLSEKLKKTP